MISCANKCGSQVIPKYKIDNYQIYDCAKCNHRFIQLGDGEQHVQKTYDDTYFFNGGAGYDNYLKNRNILENQGKRYARLLENYMNPGNMLDVGAAAGFLLNGFLSKGWTGKGIEPNKRMVEYGKEQLGLEMEEVSYENFSTNDKYDLVVMIQVIAHFYDLDKVLEKTRTLLKKDGFLLIETWDRDSMTARLLGKNWHEYSPPSVAHWFSRTTLNDMCSNYGLKKVDSGRPVKKIHGSHVKSLLHYKFSENSKFWTRSINLIPGKMVIPYLPEDLFWGLYQKQ